MDTQFAENLIDSTGSTTGSLTESQFIDLLQNNPQLAQGLNSVEGGDSSTTVDQLFQKLSDGSSSISLSELGSALGQVREQMQQDGPIGPPPDAASTSSSIDLSTSPSAALSSSSSVDVSTSSSVDVTGSTTIGELSADGVSASGKGHHAHHAGGGGLDAGTSSAVDTSTSSSIDLSSSSSLGTLTSLESSTDLSSVVSVLEQVLQNLQQQQQGYNQSGASNPAPTISVFQTST